MRWFRRRRAAEKSDVSVIEREPAPEPAVTIQGPDQPHTTAVAQAPGTLEAPPIAPNDLEVTFLAQGEQTGEQIATRLAEFIAGAQETLAIAAYDLRLSPPLRAIVEAALRERARSGVAIRLVYDADKPAQLHLIRGMDPAPSGTGAFVQSLGFPSRRIAGLKLMHHKYAVRDPGLPSARVWTGSTNFTDDAWTLEENNILQLGSAAVATRYAEDFEELWNTGDIENTGSSESLSTTLMHDGAPAQLQLFFAPGCGQVIDEEVARRVSSATRRVRVCSMLLNSSALVEALQQVLRRGDVAVDGIYDETQMQEVFIQWQDVPHNRWKIGAVRDIIQDARLVGKHSTPYKPTSRHDFMHNKILLVDDLVITGSYNFSHSAEQNAENILFVESPSLAVAYSRYIDHLTRRYGGTA
jgi:phosphatidylserine/phosphatidylglycerophosphate/cardiolipin synthase-like enzyme